MKNKFGFNKFIFWLLGIGVLGIVLIAVMVIVVDPFFHYHKPLTNFPYQVDNQLSQNPGMAMNMEYDSVIIGSSMTVNFNTNWFEEELGLDTIKLSYSGAYPKDMSNILKPILQTHPDTEVIFMGLDVFNYSAELDQTKYPIPEYLYDDNYLNDISYVLNKDVILDYILRPMADPEPTDLATVYASWWTDDYYNLQWVMHNYERPTKVEEEIPYNFYEVNVRANMKENILPYIEGHPNTKFTIFYPPYSILFWNDAITQNQLEAILYEYQIISEILMECPNVELFFFTDEADIITDLNNYADYTHYHPDINHYMVKCFADGTDKIETHDELMEHIDHLRVVATSFDYEELLSKEW